MIFKNQEDRGAGRGNAILPVQVLSGRSGRRLWSAGPLPPLGSDAFGYSYVEGIDLRDGDSTGIADLLVVHDPKELGKAHLTRLSGRDGRVVWDIPLVEHTANITKLMGLEPGYGDLDGDGRLDLVLRSYATPTPRTTTYELRAVSFRDGKTLWTHAIRAQNAKFAVGDLDGDGRAEVIVSDQPPKGTQAVIELTALDGRHGASRWNWRGAGVRGPSGKIAPFCLADFEGKGSQAVCVNHRQRVVILDAQGRERTGGKPGAKPAKIAACADLDGDGRDELLVQGDDRLYAYRGDLTELWSRPNREPVQRVIPAQKGQSATVVLSSMVALDGVTGRTCWKGRHSGGAIDPGCSAPWPRLLTVEHDATICTLALPTTPNGPLEPARGTPVPPGLAADDPRWARPLPWSRRRGGDIPLLLYLGLAALATINIVVPLLIVRMATRRRIWSVRLLLALPAVVAIPMTAFLTFASAMPSMSGASAVRAIALFSLATLGGLPVVVYVALIGSSLLRRRWRRFIRLAVLSGLATIGLAAYWLWYDGLRKPAIEHYTWSDWHAVIVPGLYLAGVLAMVAWVVRGAWRFIGKQWRRRRAVAMNPS